MDSLTQSDIVAAVMALCIFTFVRGVFYHAFYKIGYLAYTFVLPGLLYHFTVIWFVPGGNSLLYAEYMVALAFLMLQEMAGHSVHRYFYRILDLGAITYLVAYSVNVASFTLYISVFAYTAAGKSWSTKPSYW